MIDFDPLFRHIAQGPLSEFSDALQKAIAQRMETRSHGDLAEWQQVFRELPAVSSVTAQLDQETICLEASPALNPNQQDKLRATLMKLHPWRKGPFRIFNLFIDTEWRSDWKWQRLAPHISNLAGRTVLDVGCGSGYHCWRMRGAGADLVIGIDPSPKFILQFSVFKHYLPQEPVFLLPLLCEDLPQNLSCFDTVFSMGVLYHRKSPFEHLEELKAALRPGGELVLETLVVEGDANTILVPRDRYAQMRNVFFIPSTLALENWLQRLGFIHIRTVDINQTSVEEQHKTDWMSFQSLQDFLDPQDSNRTIEGYPAPRRAILVAEKP